MSYLASVVKSVQSNYGQNPSGVGNYVDVALGTAVDINASIILPQGFIGHGTNGLYNGAGTSFVWMLNGSTVRVGWGGTNVSPGDYIRFTVMEFYNSVVKSKGQGAISIPDGQDSAQVGVTAVNLAKTMLVLSGWTFNNSLTFSGGVNSAVESLVESSIVWTNSSTLTGYWVHGFAGNPNAPLGRQVVYNYIEFR